MGLVMRTQSSMTLKAAGSLATLVHHGGWNQVRNPRETSRNPISPDISQMTSESMVVVPPIPPPEKLHSLHSHPMT